MINPSVVLFVSDVPGMTTFYRELGSMALLHQDDGHAVLQTGGVELVIHAIRGEPAPERQADGSVRVREDSYFKFCLPVASISEARVRASALGGGVKPAEHEWESRGFRACDGHDPEGNVLQVRESA